MRLSLPSFSRIEISMDVPGKRAPLTAALNLTPNVGWRYDTRGKPPAKGAIVIPPVIPPDATPSDIAMGFWAGATSILQFIDKVKNPPKTTNNSSSASTAGADCTSNYMNIGASENLVCTFVGPILNVEYPCGNTVTLDLQSCCIQHDISCWCGPTVLADATLILPWLTEINTALAACVAGKILGSIGQAHVSWWCGGIITAAIFAASAVIVFAIWFAATEIFLTGSVLDQILGGNVVGIPIDGRNKASCLCGWNHTYVCSWRGGLYRV